MVLPEEGDIEKYIRQLESTYEKYVKERETPRNENETPEKKLLLYESPYTPQSRKMFTPKITNPP